MNLDDLRTWLHRRYIRRTASAYAGLLRAPDPVARCRVHPSLANGMLGALRALRAYVADTGADVVLPDAETLAELRRIRRDYELRRPRRAAVVAGDLAPYLAAALDLDPGERGVVPALMLGAFAGLRAGSILGVCWDDVDWRGGTLRVAVAKGRRPYAVPLHPRLADYLWGLARRRPDDDDRVVTWGRSHLYAAFRALGLQPHALRRGFATAMLERGTPLATVARLMNHASTATTYGYYRPTDDALREAIGGLEGDADGR